MIPEFTTLKIRKHLFIYSIPIWVLIIFYPFIQLINYGEHIEFIEEQSIYFQAFAIVIFVASVCYSGKTLLKKKEIMPSISTFLIFSIFFFLLFNAIAHKQSFNDFIFPFVIFIFLATINLWWKLSLNIDARNSLKLTSITLYGLLLVALLIHGLPMNRWIGGIPPTYFAQNAFSALFFYILACGRIKLIPLLITSILIIVVNARATFLFTILFLVIYYILEIFPIRESIRYDRRYLYIFIMFFSFFSCFLGAIYFWDYLKIFIDSFFKLDDLTRGLHTGLSRRTIYWEEAWLAAIDNPIIGYGFQIREGIYIHNGILAVLYEFGLISGAILLGVHLLVILIIIKRALKYKNAAGIEMLAAYAVVFLFYNLVEENLMSFGNIPAFIFWIALLSPPGFTKFRI